MMEWSDIRTGGALWVAGLIALAAWVWREVDDANSRLPPPLWAALTLLTAGLAALVRIALDRKRGSVRDRACAMAFAVAWMIATGLGAAGLADASARNRATGAPVGHFSSPNAQTEPSAPPPGSGLGSDPSAGFEDSLGDFDSAFPPPGRAPAPSP